MQDLRFEGREYIAELDSIGCELKDTRTGLIDFRSRLGGREVYLCWKLGEREIEHWHELDAGFSGRRSIADEAFSGA